LYQLIGLLLLLPALVLPFPAPSTTPLFPDIPELQGVGKAEMRG
jgi:hypothetical protein